MKPGRSAHESDLRTPLAFWGGVPCHVFGVLGGSPSRVIYIYMYIYMVVYKVLSEVVSRVPFLSLSLSLSLSLLIYIYIYLCMYIYIYFFPSAPSRRPPPRAFESAHEALGFSWFLMCLYDPGGIE